MRRAASPSRHAHGTWVLRGTSTRIRTSRMRRHPATRASRPVRSVEDPKGPWRLRWTRPDGSSFAGDVYNRHTEAEYWAGIAERGNLESCVVTVEPIDP